MGASGSITHSYGNSVLDSISDDYVWESLIVRKESINPNDPDVELLKKKFNDPICRALCNDVSQGIHHFSVPKKKLIPKGNSGKMRTVYQFDEDEMVSLKIIADCLYNYDYLFSENLYSFRRNVYVRDAIRKLLFTEKLSTMWGYKADVHNYFNSIPVEPLLKSLRLDVSDDGLYALFEQILLETRVFFRGKEIEEQKGVMAGIPISAFLANYYLKDVDAFFSSLDCVYMRYADDILIFSDSEERMNDLRNLLLEKMKEKGLEMNPDKEFFFSPGEKFDFLGFQISDGTIDISSNTVRKMKGRIRRSARKIRRWMLEKDAPVMGTARALIRSFNRTFYGWDSGEFSWAAWYFSTITTTRSLHEIDLYCQDWIRYIASGRHIKKNHSLFTYEMMRDCGYRPLVSEYYKPRGNRLEDTT